MDLSFGSRLRHAWNAFLSREPTLPSSGYGPGFSYRPDRPRLSRGNERSIVTSVYNRIAMDVASVSIQHALTDENGRYRETVDSGLNRCLSLSANLDQSGRAFLQDVALSMMDEGCIAIVPVEADGDPPWKEDADFDVLSLRTGKITAWFPEHIRFQRSELIHSVAPPPKTGPAALGSGFDSP